MKIKTAMILAAGYGTRMKELTKPVPKPLLPLKDKRIIEYILEYISLEGIKRAVINLHYLAHQVESYIGNGERFGLEILYSEERKLLGTGGGIAKAEHHFESETIICVNADVLSNLRIQNMFDYHNQENALATMAVLPSKNNRDYSLVVYDHNNNLKGFLKREQPIPQEFNSGIFTGHHILTPQARKYLKPEFQSVMSELYSPALRDNQKVKIYPFNGEWIDLGTKRQYLDFKNEIQEKEIVLSSLAYQRN
jgi:NDP-sugar pyrophosphorylase family protein